MKPITKQLIQEIINKKNEEEKELGLQASYTPAWTVEDVIGVAIRHMHERVVGGK